MNDLFSNPRPGLKGKYTAKDIEVLEGLEPVRRRPGMYIGGVDEGGLHHLAAEVLDNAMDEAVAGYASRIEVTLHTDGSLTIEDNGRGIPVDPHPKYKSRSALEVILTTLHAGAKFSDKVYHTAGGLHGVGVSVVNALAERLEVEVARDRKLWAQSFQRGKPKSKLRQKGTVRSRRGTRITFWPDLEIFGSNIHFIPARLYRMARSKAYLFQGVKISWKCDPNLLSDGTKIPEAEVLHFPGGLADYLNASLGGRESIAVEAFTGSAALPKHEGRAEWAINWPIDGEGFLTSYVNTVPTPVGGTHETGLRGALAKGLKAYGERVKQRRAIHIIPDDVAGSAVAVLSVFLREPQFHGQTKEKLGNPGTAKTVENVVRDHFDHWLTDSPDTAKNLLEFVIERVEARLRRKQEKEVARKSATRRLRLPGKLADCTRSDAQGTELLLVEGDSAGGSAKQARNRETQAVLPLRGKVLNVASAAAGKLHANQEISNILLALGCGSGSNYDESDLRYEKIIIMTDADVDGAHIASLLMTFFYREIPGLIRGDHLYLAMPPLYRLTQGTVSVYASDDAHKEALLKKGIGGRGTIEINRFKGLGEMPAAQLKSTTMDPAKRTLLRITIGDTRDKQINSFVEQLMGRKPEFRLAFIQEHATDAGELDV